MAVRRLHLSESCPGEIFLHSMPGRCESLSQFIEELRELGIDLVVCLAGEEEIRQKSPFYGKLRENEGLQCDTRDLPIPDYGVPADPEAFRRLVVEVAQLVQTGRRVLVHCAGGVGRTGTFVICVLLALGDELEEATKRVKEAGSHPETHEQRELVRRFAAETTGGN